MKWNKVIAVMAVSVQGFAGTFLWVPAALAQTNAGVNVAIPPNTSPPNTNGPGPVQTTNLPANLQNVRIVDGQAYDPANSTRWVTLILPEESALLNERQINFTGSVQPITAVFSVPLAKRAPETVVIHNFPFNPTDFFRRMSTTGLETRLRLQFRVFPLVTKTNWTASGEMRITPVRPVYDYGLPPTTN